MRKSLSFKLTVFATNVLLCGLALVLYCDAQYTVFAEMNKKKQIPKKYKRNTHD